MVRIFYKDGKQVKKETDVRELGLLKNLMWVDLQSATNDEEEWVETKCNISFQTPQEIVEIESSARYFEQNNTINANSNFLLSENDGYSFYPVSFLIRDNILFTFRQGDSKTFADTVKKIKIGEEIFKDGVDILLVLLETRIESDADLLEAMSKEVKSISRTLSREKKPKQDSLLRINNLQENTMMIRESIIDKQRMLSQILRSSYFPEDRKERLRIVLKDITSLLEYTTFNFERLEYLQDTFMGLINLEQNEIIKIFTVVTICFLPPTLIAGVFGMNYDVIPSLQHPNGFWLAVALMITSSLGFLFFFKRRKWI